MILQLNLICMVSIENTNIGTLFFRDRHTIGTLSSGCRHTFYREYRETVPNVPDFTK